MNALLQRLPAFALPFVTRSLRGGRGRRFTALSSGLALLTLWLSLWIGLGEGEAARDARVSIGMEQPTYLREQQEFVVIRGVHDNPALLAAREQAQREEGAATLRASLTQQPLNEEQYELQARARELAVVSSNQAPEIGFSWHNPVQVRRLTSVIERRGVPAVVDYESPVDLRGTLQLLGMLSGGLLILLAGVVAPLLVALQQASERNENTLQPLTGTALGGRELALGLACGPLAVVAIFAAPIAAIFVGATVSIGTWGALAILPVLAGTAIGLVFGAQLLAHMTGARRTPGMIAIGLLSLLGLVTLSGIGAAAGLDRETLGVPAVLPHVGMFGMLGESFGDPWQAAATHRWPNYQPTLLDLLVPSMIGMLGATLLGLLALRALTRHIEGRSTLLEAGQALFGALICVVMINVAIPMKAPLDEPFHQVFGLPLLSLPFILLIMARVPVGDMPTKLRRIPVTRLLAEFAGWTMLELLVAAALDGTIAGLHPMTLIGVGWCVLVLVLIAVRLAATPARILGHVWVLVCIGMLPFTFGFATVWAFSPERAFEVFEEVPAFLTVPWALLLVWIPVSLFRHLRSHVARLE
ncbi:hypothetical protein ACNOYE_26780 [Nannocystaceae bacterium ST9]